MDPMSLYLEIFGCRVEFGWNALSTLGTHVKKLGSRKALIVTDEGVYSLGIPERISQILKKEGIGVAIFKDVSPDPTDTNVRKGVTFFKDEKCDLIIGVGGGSAMDAAKGVKVLSSHPEPLRQYFGATGAEKIVKPMPPLIAISTTSGTGSETSRAGVITDTERNVKCTLRAGLPQLSLVDPELTLGMPPRLTAATGMDALTHNVEAYLSPRFHPCAEAVALEGIRLTAENLLTAVEDGKNQVARTHMAMASSMGSLAFQKGLGVAHSLAHQLSTDFNVHHGLACAIVLPHTMEFNKSAAGNKLRNIAFAMGAKIPSAESAIEAVFQLTEKIGLPTKLSKVNVVESGIPVLARKAMEDWCHPNNPRTCTESDMAMLFRNAY